MLPGYPAGVAATSPPYPTAVTVNAAVAARIVSLRDLAREIPEAPALGILDKDQVEVLVCRLGKG